MNTTARLQRAEARARLLRSAEIDPAERDRFAWFAHGCACGLPPGECSTHPRARPAQRPPTDRDWRTFALVSGRGSGKTRSGVCWVIDRVN
jgi:hypothetical protein